MKSGHRNLRVGLIGLGLKAYCPQFEGLKDRLSGYISFVERGFKDYRS